MNADDAKILMAGPLGKEMEKFPLRFCKPGFFGEPPSQAHPTALGNGTATLVNIGYGPFAITCAHVLEGFCLARQNSPKCFFQIGNCRLDPFAQIRSLDTNLDFATIALTENQAVEITRNSNEIGELFYRTQVWPPIGIVTGDFVAFAGFPGELRKVVSLDEISFGSYSSGAARVTSAHDNYFVCQFEREEWVQHFGETEPETIRGLSGGPAFVLRHSTAGVISYEFAGIIYQFSEDYELLYIKGRQSNTVGSIALVLRKSQFAIIYLT